MKKEFYSKSATILIVLGLLTSCSKGGLFGAGYLTNTIGGVITSAGDGGIDIPNSFSSYQPPGNSKMTELKSNISGANNDIMKTIGASTYFGPFTDAAGLEDVLADETKGPILKALLSSLGLSYKNCTSDDGIKITDGTTEITLEDAYVTQSEEKSIACPFSVTDYSIEIKDELTSSKGTTASLTSGQEAGVTALLSYIQEQTGRVDCSSDISFSQEFKISDFQNECEFFQGKILIGGVEQDYKVYDRIAKRDELKQSLKYTIIQEIAKDDSAKEIKTYAENMIQKSPTLKKDLAKYIKKEAQEELLQVSLNSFMAHGVNFFSVLTYLGLDSSDVLKSVGGNSEKMKLLFDKYKYSVINTEIAKGDLFFAYKPGFRFFVDMFVAGKIDALDSNGLVINDGVNATDDDLEKLRSAKKFRYYINKENLCRFLSLQSNKDADDDVISSKISECLGLIEAYIDRSIVIHDMSTKKVSFYYADDEFQFPQAKIMDVVYTYNYNSDIRFDIDTLRKATISVLKREENNSAFTNPHESAAFLEAITTSGIFSVRDQVQVGGQVAGSQKSLADIGLTTLASSLSLSVGDLTDSSSNEGIYIRIPENAPGSVSADSDFNSVFKNTDGDVVFDIKKADKLVYLDHDRGNSIFKDRVGLDIPEMAITLPPFDLNQKDFVIAYLELDEYCDSGTTTLPSGYAGCEAQFSLVKPKVGNDLFGLSRLNAKEYLAGHMGEANFLDYNGSFGLSGASIKINGAPKIKDRDKGYALNNSTANNFAAAREWDDIDNHLIISPYRINVHLNNEATGGTSQGRQLVQGMTGLVGDYDITATNHETYKMVFDSAMAYMPDGHGQFPDISIDHLKLSGKDSNAQQVNIERCLIPVTFIELTTGKYAGTGFGKIEHEDYDYYAGPTHSNEYNCTL